MNASRVTLNCLKIYTAKALPSSPFHNFVLTNTTPSYFPADATATTTTTTTALKQLPSLPTQEYVLLLLHIQLQLPALPTQEYVLLHLQLQLPALPTQEYVLLHLQLQLPALPTQEYVHLQLQLPALPTQEYVHLQLQLPALPTQEYVLLLLQLQLKLPRLLQLLLNQPLLYHLLLHPQSHPPTVHLQHLQVSSICELVVMRVKNVEGCRDSITPTIIEKRCSTHVQAEAGDDGMQHTDVGI